MPRVMFCFISLFPCANNLKLCKNTNILLQCLFRGLVPYYTDHPWFGKLSRAAPFFSEESDLYVQCVAPVCSFRCLYKGTQLWLEGSPRKLTHIFVFSTGASYVFQDTLRSKQKKNNELGRNGPVNNNLHSF
jgi:hypothetical protein